MLGLGCFCILCFLLEFSVKVKLSVPLLCVCVCILPEKAVLKMTYTVSSGMLNPTHSFTLQSGLIPEIQVCCLKTIMA